MATKIRLFERGPVDPAINRVKPSFALAEGAGLAELGATATKFAGKIFDAVVKTTAANEKAAFRSGVVTAMGDFDVFVKANPGASYEEIGNERKKMMEKIEKFGQKATTLDAQQNNKLYFATKKASILASTQATMEATRVKQELLTYQSQQKVNMNNFDEVNYIKLQEDMFDANLIDEEVGLAQRELDFVIMNKAEEKAALGNAVGIGFEAWQATVTKEDPDGNLNVAFDVINALDIPEGEKQEIESELKTRVQNRRAEAKLEAEQADAKSVETISGWINDNDLTGIVERINKLPLTETRKREEIKKANAHIAAINKGDISPFNQTDPVVYADLLTRIRNDPRSVTQPELDKLHGKGIKGGISTTKWKELADDIGADPASVRSKSATYKDYSKVLNQWRQDDLFSKDPGENSTDWGKMQSDYNTWFDAFVEKSGREPTYQESVNWGEFKTLDIVENMFAERIQRIPFFLDPSGLARGLQLILPKPGAVKDRFDALGTLSADEQSGLVEAGEITKEGIKRIEKARGEAGNVTMISPEGETFSVPEDKKQVFLDNGFTEQ